MFIRDPITGLWKPPTPRARFYLPGSWAPARRALGPIIVTDLGNGSDTGALATGTFSGFTDYPSAGRAVAIIMARDGASAYTASSVAFGGLGNGTVHADCGAVGVQTTIVIASKIVSAGAVGNIVATFNETLDNDKICTLLHLSGTGVGTALASTPIETTDAVSDAVISGTIDCPRGGIVIAGAVATGAGLTLDTWAGVSTVDNSQITADSTRFGCAHSVFAAAQSGLTISATFSGTSGQKALAAVAFAEG